MNSKSDALAKRVMKCIAMIATVSFFTSSVGASDYPERGDATQGAQQWADNCVRCHNLRSPEDLTDDQWITAMFHMRLRAGLTGSETRNILTFLQTSNNATVANPTSVSAGMQPDTGESGLSGKAVYDQTCVVCHGADGKGSIPGVPDLSGEYGRMAKSDDQLLQNIMFGFKTAGSAMPMPAKGGNPNLTKSEIRSVIEYLRSAFGS